MNAGKRLTGRCIALVVPHTCHSSKPRLLLTVLTTATILRPWHIAILSNDEI
jgi:hypothetical protein